MVFLRDPYSARMRLDMVFEMVWKPLSGDIRSKNVRATIDLQHIESTQNGFRSEQPAEPHTGTHCLRKGRDVDRRFGVVHLVDRGNRFADKAEIVIGVVFKDRRAGFLGHIENSLASLERHRHPGRVLVIGHQVDELRCFTAALAGQ